jgi:hypothetical protein
MTATRTLVLSAIAVAEIGIFTAAYVWFYVRRVFDRGFAIGADALRALTIYNPIYWFLVFVILTVTILLGRRWLRH